MKKKFTLLFLMLFCFSIVQFHNPVEALQKGTYAGIDDDGYTYYITGIYPNGKGRKLTTFFVTFNVESPLDTKGRSKTVRCSWDYMKELGGWVIHKDVDKTGKKDGRFNKVKPGTIEHDMLMYCLDYTGYR